jgi:hypothetical protein
MADEQKPRGRGRPRRLTSVVAAGSEATSEASEPAAPPGRRPRSNTASDKAFIDSAAHSGQLKVWEGHLVWSGRTEDLLHPYQVPDDNRRCQHLRQMKDDLGQQILDVDKQPLKERCPNWAMLGANICVQHAKGSKAVMDAAREMIAGAAPALVGQLIKEAFSDSILSSPGDRIKAINSLLDRFGLRGGIEVGPDMPAWREIMDELGKETGVTE